MEKNIVFAFERRNISDIIKRAKQESEVLVICRDSQISKRLLDNGINTKVLNEYRLTEEETIKPIEWMKSWPNKIIENEKNFKELFTYKDISIFWFLESRLYHKRIHELITTIEQIKKILLVENPEKIVIFQNKELFFIISHLHKNVELIKENDKIKKSNTAENSHSGFLTWKLLLLKILRGGIKPTCIDKKTNPILFLTEVGGWRKAYNYFSKKYEYQDVFFHSIIKKLIGKGKFVEVVDFENNPKRLFRSTSINEERAKSFGTQVTPWEKFLTVEIIIKSKNSHKEFKNKWNRIKNSEKFGKLLDYDEIPLYSLLEDDFDKLFNSFKALAAIAMIETAQRIVELKRPSTIVMHDEYGALQLSFIVAAKKSHIPTISLQHGTIYENAFAYTHNEKDINNHNGGSNFPLPNKMYVWSENAKKSLIHSGKFLPSTLIVTGDPKMEFYNEIQKNFDRRSFFERLKIPCKKKVILFATENLPNSEERDLIANTIFESMMEMSDSFLIIKIHPNETDATRYEKIAAKFGIKSYAILNDENIYALIYASDLVIISYSTVGLESMRMSKPVISLNLMEMHNDSIIIKNNLATVVTSTEQLVPTIRKSLYEPDRKKMEISRNFAESDLGKININPVDIIVKDILDSNNTKQEGFEE